MRAGKVGRRKPGEAGIPMRIGKSLTHRTDRGETPCKGKVSRRKSLRKQRPEKGELAEGETEGHSAKAKAEKLSES